MTAAGIRKVLNRFRRDREGSMLLEMAMAMPVLMTLMLGGMEVARYVLLHQKLDRVASSIADLVSQAERVTVVDLQNIFDAAQYVARPFDLPAGGTVIVTSVTNPIGGGGATVNWQQAGAGAVSATSHVGAPGGAATLPSGFTLADGQTIIIAEVFYDYEPWIAGGVTGSSQLYQRALFRPRYGGLTILYPSS